MEHRNGPFEHQPTSGLSPSTSASQEKCCKKKLKLDCSSTSTTRNPEVQGEEETEESRGNDRMNPLLMQDTIGYILQHLNGGSLKSCRLVSKLWREEATKIFFKNNYARVSSRFHDYFKAQSEDEQIMIMLEPMEFFARYRIKPNVVIRDIRDIKLFTQLRMLGRNIKCIKMNSNFTSQNNYIKTIGDLLHLCPNVKFLDTQEPKDFEEEEEEEDDDNKYNFGLALMDMCSYLDKSIQQSLTISHLDIDLNLILTDEDNHDFAVSDYEKFSNSSIGIHNLKILMAGRTEIGNHQIGQRLVKSTSKLLHSSKDVLTKLEFGFAIINTLNIPVLSKLDVLEIYMTMELAVENLFHSSFRFEQHFPNLRVFRLNLYDVDLNSPNIIQQIFGSCGEAPSVKKLRCNLKLKISAFQQLLEIFPFVENLNYMINPDKNFYPIWKLLTYLNLKKLVLYYVDLNDPENFLIQMTGLSRKEVENLWNNPNNINLQKIREVKFSMTSLQNLQKLVIYKKFYFSSYAEEDSKVLLILEKYAKKFMPKLTKILIKR